MIKTIVVDDEIILRESLKRLIEFDDDITVIGCGGNGFEAFELCETFVPEIVLMDIIMPDCDGIEGTRLIKEKFPSIKVLILTTFDDDENIAKALQNGADGYVLKSITPDELVLAIKSVAKGMGIMHKKIFNTVAKQFEAGDNTTSKAASVLSVNLSPRERKLLEYIVHGKSNKEIAIELFLAEGTVKNLVAGLLEKLSLKDRTQLAVFAVINHLV